MNEIETYIAIAERFSWTLSVNRRRDKQIGDEIAGLHPDDNAGVERLADKALELQRSLFAIRNELDAATQPLKDYLASRQIDSVLVMRVTNAAWHHTDRFHDEWFNCHAFLKSIPATRVSTETLTDDTDEQIHQRVEAWFSELLGQEMYHSVRGVEMAKKITAATWESYKRHHNTLWHKPITTSADAYFRKRSAKAATQP